MAGAETTGQGFLLLDKLGRRFFLLTGISEIFPIQMRGPAMAVCTMVD